MPSLAASDENPKQAPCCCSLLVQAHVCPPLNLYRRTSSLTRYSVIALSILHLNALQRYATGTPSSIHLIPSIILQEVLLATALITATIPNMRAFVQSLSGSWGDPNYVFTRESTKYSGSAIFGSKNMKSTKSEGLSTKTADLHLVPNSTVSETRVDSSIEEQRDRGSLERNGSQDMIIRKKMAWKVERS
jgi:hypothetical protein